MPVLFRERIPLQGWEETVWEFHLQEGMLVTGTVFEENHNWLKIFLFDRENYLRKRQGNVYHYWGGSGISGFNYNLRVPRTGTYYLLVGHNDWFGRAEIARINLDYQ